MTELITAGSAVAERFDRFRHAVSDTFVPLTTTTDDVAAFRGRVRTASLGTVQLSDVAATGNVARRTPSLIRRSDPGYLKLGLQVRGYCVLSQDGREAVLAPGDFTVYDTTRPYQLAFDDAYRMLVVMFPRNLLRVPTAQLARLTARRVSGRQGPGALVTSLLVELSRQLDAGELAANIHLSDAILDLLAASFAEGVECAADPNARRRGLLLRIQAFVSERLRDPDLDLATVAAAHHISIRYLQKLFEEEGETVTGWIRARRLEQCRKDLAEVRLADLPVSSIAARWGLADAARFSRLFKAAYGVSPKEYRGNVHAATTDVRPRTRSRTAPAPTMP